MKLRLPSALAAVLALFWLLPWDVAAQVPDPFTVTDVPVDASGANAVEARARALAEGERAAFRRLLHRLTPESEWPRLPQADGGTVQAAVRAIQVAGERTSATRYLARMTVAFNREPVRRLLRENGIPFTETGARPVLLVPVWRGAEGPLLWEADNPWRQAWAARPERDPLAVLLLPDADKTEGGPSALVAESGEAGTLRAFARQFGAEQALIAEARPVAGGVEVTTRTTEDDGETAAQVYPGLDAAAAAIARQWDESWKQRTLLNATPGLRMRVDIPIQGIGDWVQIRQRLAETPAASDVVVAAMTANKVEILMTPLGGTGALRLALRQRDLALVESDGMWRIERLGGQQRSGAAPGR